MLAILQMRVSGIANSQTQKKKKIRVDSYFFFFFTVLVYWKLYSNKVKLATLLV
jgi:hypothetical protein